MPVTVAADTAVAGGPSGRRMPAATGGLIRACETALDLSVVVLATWTVAYHVCLVLGLGVSWSVAFELVLLAAALVLWRRSVRGATVQAWVGVARSSARAHLRFAASTPIGAVLFATVIASASTAAFLIGVDGPWPWSAAAWLIAGVAGTALAVLHLRRTTAAAPAPQDSGEEHDGGEQDGVGVAVALVWAAALAALSMFTRWPNPDDLFYVNLSQWVVEHGTFPVRDTIFSDLVFPMATWPPVASYDALAGVVASLAGVHAASVVYLVVPPVATFLSVLALWRLLRAWRVRSVWVGLSLALVFLLTNGGSGYAAPGNLFLTRMWQGKVILLCLIVPILLVYALRYVERPTMARAGWLFAGGVAAVGLTTTAMFLVPLLALGGAAPLALRQPRLALRGFCAMASYPLAAGVVTLLAGGRSADLFDTRKVYRFDPGWFGPEILRDGPIAVLAVFGVLAGALLLPRHAARVTTGVLAVIVGVSFVPGVTQLSYDLVGLGPTLWRVSWVAPIAALVGVLGVELGARARRNHTASVAAFLAALLIWWGLPIWSASIWVTMDSSPQWKRDPGEVAVAQRAIDAVRPGDTILAPQNLAVTITVMTTRVKTVAPRDYFMDYLRDEPEFRYTQRQTLWDFAADEYVMMMDKPDVAAALTALHVDEVCLPTESDQRKDFLRDEGYRTVILSPSYTCLTR